MSGNVVSLDSRRPHAEGKVVCMACRHEWHAVVPLFDDGSFGFLECPSCGLEKGTFKFTFLRGEVGWHCLCENDLFRFSGSGHAYCPNCGRWQPAYLDDSGGPRPAA